jgi:hypothetical protein
VRCKCTSARANFSLSEPAARPEIMPNSAYNCSGAAAHWRRRGSSGRSRAFWGGAGLPGGARLRRSMSEPRSQLAGGGAARVSAPDTQTDRQTRQTEKVTERERREEAARGSTLAKNIHRGGAGPPAEPGRLRFGGLLGICVLLDLT